MTRWLLPGGGVVVTLAFALALAPASILDEAARGYPWVAFALTFLLAAAFHRTRAAALVLVLAGAAWASGSGAEGAVELGVLGCTVALVAGVLALSLDRGITAPAGLAQLGFAALVGGIGVTAALAPPEAVVSLLSTPSFPSPVTAWTGLPEMTVLLGAFAALAVAYAALRRRGPVERGLVWFLPTAALGLHPAMAAHRPLLFLMAASLVLALSVVETGHAMAYRDDLTGLPARRALLRDLEALGSTFAVAMVDVDHFKKFNDRHGHDVGDQVLRMVGGCLARAPGGARGYRYGGEEFTLLLPGLTREEALPHLEAVRTSVAASSFAVRGWRRPARKPERPKKATEPSPRHLSVTVSIGVADASGRGATPESVLKKADEALYRAKRAGRNRVSV